MAHTARQNRLRALGQAAEVWYTDGMSLLASLRAVGNPVPAHRRLLWALVAIALGLRLLRLNFQPLWWDEGWSLYFTTEDVASLLRLTAVDIHPPLYYLLLQLWIGLLGASPVAVRLLSVLLGTATVPLLYTTGRRLIGERGALLAAALLAISPFHIYYSQEVRMYGLVTLLGLAVLLFGSYLAEGRGRPWAWPGYALAAAAALYTQYYAAFLLLGINLAVGARWLRERCPARQWLPWLGAQAAAAALFLPWLGYAGPKLLEYVRYKVGVEADVPLGLFPYLARHLAALGWGHAEGALAEWWWLGLVPLGIVGLVAAIALPSRQTLLPAPRRGRTSPPTPSWGRTLCALILSTLLLGGFAVNLVAPFDAPRIERQLLLGLPATLLLLAAAVVALRHHRLAGAIPLALVCMAGLVSLGFFYSVPRYPDDDYRPLAARLRALGQPSDVAVCVHPWQVGYLKSYLAAPVRPGLLLTPRQVLPEERQLWADDPARLMEDLDRLLSGSGRVWLPAHQAMGRVLEDAVDAYLSTAGYPILAEWHGPNTRLSLYADLPTHIEPAPIRFGDWLYLEQAGLPVQPVESAWGVVPVELTWNISALPAAPYVVGLQLVDGTGTVWAQRDSEPMGGREPFSGWLPGQPRADRHGLLVPAGTPPGAYRLTLRVYWADGLSPLPASLGPTLHVGTIGAPIVGGSDVTLGTVQVVRPAQPPPVEALHVQALWPRRARFGDVLRFVGLDDRTAGPLVPGQAVAVDLYWQALRDPGEDYYPHLRLVDARGAVVAELTEKPVTGTYPTAWWRAGELVRDPHTLYVPAAAEPGRYRLVLGLVRASDGAEIAVRRGSPLLAEVEVAARERCFVAPAPQQLQSALVGEAVELVGYDVSPPAPAAGTMVRITLYWHALATPEQNLHAFVHVLDDTRAIVAQHDGPPLDGRAPTLGWLPGEYLADPHDVILPTGLPAGEYRLEVGLYDPVTFQRPGEAVVLDLLLRVKAAR